MKRLTYGTEGAKFDGLVKTLKESFSIAEGAKLRILYTDSDGDKVGSMSVIHNGDLHVSSSVSVVFVGAQGFLVLPG